MSMAKALDCKETWWLTKPGESRAEWVARFEHEYRTRLCLQKVPPSAFMDTRFKGKLPTPMRTGAD